MATHAHMPSTEDAPLTASDLLTVTEAARWAGVTRYTVSGWITGGRLPAVLVDGRRRVRLADLAAVQVVAHVGGVVPAWRRDPRRAGLRLRALREAAGLTQLELETASGLRHETISRLELGDRAPHAESVQKLARALRVAPAQFVGEEEVAAVGLTAAAAAARLGVPVARLQAWLSAGTLAGVKVSGQWRVSTAAVAALLGSGRLRGHSRRLDPRFRG